MSAASLYFYLPRLVIQSTLCARILPATPRASRSRPIPSTRQGIKQQSTATHRLPETSDALEMTLVDALKDPNRPVFLFGASKRRATRTEREMISIGPMRPPSGCAMHSDRFLRRARATATLARFDG